MHSMNPGAVQESLDGFGGSRSQSMPLLSVWGQHQAQQQWGQQQQQQPPPTQAAQQQQFQQQQLTNQQMQQQQYQNPRPFEVPLNDVAPKRDRIAGPQSPEEDVPQQKSGKRSRGNTYRAPREVKQTVTSVMGSLVGGAFQQSNGTVKMRRQLSSSQLDQFMTSGGDKMDEDASPTRERAMSF